MSQINKRDLIAVKKAANQFVSDRGFKGRLKRIGNVENVVYELKDKPIIIRVTEPAHRSVRALKGELEWIAYLESCGLSVAAPIPSENGALVEKIDVAKNTYLISAFRRAPGSFFQKKFWTPAFTKSLGTLVGQMHASSKKYKPESNKRHHWTQIEYIKKAKNILPKSDTAATREFEKMFHWVSHLPHNQNTIGLVHNDLHQGNYFVDNKGTITVFDFDDCCYQYFGYDLTLVHCTFLRWYERAGKPKKFKHSDFVKTFKQAYLKQNTLADIWWRRIPLFDRWRTIEMYIWCHLMFDVKKPDPYLRKFLERSRESFTQDVKLF